MWFVGSLGECHPPQAIKDFLQRIRMQERAARKGSEILFGDIEMGYLVFMSDPSVTLTLLAFLLIIGCASTEQHPSSLEDTHGFKPTAAYQDGTQLPPDRKELGDRGHSPFPGQ